MLLGHPVVLAEDFLDVAADVYAVAFANLKPNQHLWLSEAARLDQTSQSDCGSPDLTNRSII
jgi:hypothetical protein